jgi:hypothetical protein
LWYALAVIGELAALAVLSSLMGQAVSRAVDHRRWYYALMAPGTVAHELSHLLACLVLGLKVTRVKLFTVRPMPDGTVQLGYVEHEGGGPFRRFLVGIAPVLFITGLIYLLSRLLLQPGEGFWTLLTDPGLYLFAVLAFLLALGLSPSRQDLGNILYFLCSCAFLALLVSFVVRLLDRSGNHGLVVSMGSALKTTFLALVPIVVATAALAMIVQGARFLHQARR